jgi:hypothetical protein
MPTPEEFARSILCMRDEARVYQAEAERVGNEREARAFGRELRKVEKMILDYGLERYAQRT